MVKRAEAPAASPVICRSLAGSRCHPSVDDAAPNLRGNRRCASRGARASRRAPPLRLIICQRFMARTAHTQPAHSLHCPDIAVQWHSRRRIAEAGRSHTHASCVAVGVAVPHGRQSLPTFPAWVVQAKGKNPAEKIRTIKGRHPSSSAPPHVLRHSFLATRLFPRSAPPRLHSKPRHTPGSPDPCGAVAGSTRSVPRANTTTPHPLAVPEYRPLSRRSGTAIPSGPATSGHGGPLHAGFECRKMRTDADRDVGVGRLAPFQSGE